MKPGNQRGVFAFRVVLVSVLLVSVSSVQAQTLPDVASPAQTIQAASPTETLSSSPTPPPGIKETDVSPEETLAPSPAPLPVEKETDVPTTSIPSASPTPTWNFWQSTAGNWIMFAGALITVAITATVTWLVAKRSQKAQRELERDKPRLQHESQLELKAQEEAQREQAIEKQAIAYRQKLISGLCNLQIFKMSSPLNLEDVYVKLRVRQEEKLPYAKEEERVSLAGGEPTELLRLFQGRLAQQAATAMSPEEALNQFKRITVLGEPGAGKTTILRHLAVKMANGALPNLPDLPVYVELRSFVESGMEDLLDFVVSNCAKPYNFPDRSYLEKKLNDGEAALLLDGLDEVLGGKSPEEAKQVYSRLAQVIAVLAIEFSNAPIAVTCRRAGWQGLREGGFCTLEVLDFDESQIQEFVNNWFKSDPSKAKGLQQELEKNLRMKTLAANPLILSLMAIVYGRELKLPERRFELYQHCVEVLLEEWDSEPNRGIQRLNQFTPTQMQNLLIEVAWYFHLQGKGYFREAELLGQLPSFLSNSDINIPLQENKAILEEITGSSSLLKEAAYKLYGFLHLTFQEYFTALAAKKKGSIGWQEVVAHRHEPWWEEVILLLAECMDDATPLLLGILGHPLDQSLPGDINQLVPEGKPLAVNDDLFHSDLLLAARCLVGKPQILMQGLRDRIIAEVKNLLLTSPYKFDWERATTVLVKINDKALIDELLAMLADNGINQEKRRSIASTFGKLADRSVAQRLLELLKSNRELDLFVRLNIIDALGALKATFAVSILQEMLTTENSANAKEQIIRTLGVIGNKEVASSLLDSLLDTTTDPKTKLTIAQALRNLKDESLTHRILEKLQDETIEWQVRWLLTESLEGLRESAKDSLMEMLKSQAIDEPVRVGIAATLGTWGVRESIPISVMQ
ncbi:MAG TPA: NACHT domain-containing protein [Leptolyngbyaceae cyanobacterium]